MYRHGVYYGRLGSSSSYSAPITGVFWLDVVLLVALVLLIAVLLAELIERLKKYLRWRKDQKTLQAYRLRKQNKKTQNIN